MNQKSDKTNQGISMLKNCLLIFVMFFIPHITQAQSRSPLTYEDFAHLSEKDKNRVVIKTMEFMVRLENAYRNDPRTLNLSEEEEKKFSILLKKLKGLLFLSEAYASGAVPQTTIDAWNRTAKELTDLIKQPNTTSGFGKKCIFGGWVSRTSGEGGSSIVCKHPSLLPEDSAEFKSYKNSLGSSPCGPAQNSITCNPVVFGYKSLASKQPFCVPTVNNAINTSYSCMRKALDAAPAAGIDSKETRLNFLKEQLLKEENKELFKEIHEFNYKMCVCDPNKMPDNFSVQLLNTLQNSQPQTCFGILTMIGETANVCKPQDSSIFSNGLDLSIFKEIKSKMDRLDKESNSVADNYGFLFKKYLTTLRSTKPPEYQRLCEGIQPPQGQWKCSGECEIAPDKLKCSLTVNKPDGSLYQNSSISRDLISQIFLKKENLLMVINLKSKSMEVQK